MAAERGTGWTTHSHACPGPSRTDALHLDADGTLWVGCGTNNSGYGLFLSTNGGVDWQAVSVSPASIFDNFRVSSISRGHDGALYAAGFDASNRNMVLRVDTASAPYPVDPALVGVAQVGRQFHVGTYRDLGDGRAIAEALNGNDLLYRPDGATGSSAGSWTTGGASAQMLDLVVYGDAFYGSGSRIVEPPRIFLPPTAPSTDPYEFETRELQLPSGWRGELWALAVNNRQLVAVGIDQDNNIGKIFVSGGDLYDANGYSELSMSAITGDTITWARGVCMARDRIVVVGERQPLSSGSGRVVISDNDGATFTDITPPGVSASVSRCVIEPDGTIVVVGANGFVGVRQDPDWIFRNDYERF